jgi:hypothetical protein
LKIQKSARALMETPFEASDGAGGERFFASLRMTGKKAVMTGLRSC